MDLYTQGREDVERGFINTEANRSYWVGDMSEERKLWQRFAITKRLSTMQVNEISEYISYVPHPSVARTGGKKGPKWGAKRPGKKT